MLTLEERSHQPCFCLVPETKPSALGWARMKWGKVCRGGENVPFVAPLPFSLYLSISCLPPTPTPASSLTLKGMAREGGREGVGWFIQHRLNVFTAAQCRGGVGRCKPTRGRKGGKCRKREKERERTTGWPRTDRNDVAPLTPWDPPLPVFLAFSLFLSLSFAHSPMYTSLLPQHF